MNSEQGTVNSPDSQDGTYGEGVPQPTFHRVQRGRLFSFDFSFRVDRDPGYPHNEFKPVQDQFQATTGGGSETTSKH